MVKSTTKKKLAIGIAILSVAVIAVALIIPRFIELDRYNNLITSELEKAVGGQVTLGHLSWGISNGVWLKADGFTVQNATAFPADVDMSRVYARVSILPLLSKKVVVDRLLLDNPEVAVNLASSLLQRKKLAPRQGGTGSGKNRTEDDSGPDAGATKPSSPLPVEIIIEELALRNGRVQVQDTLTLPDQKIIHNFSDVLIEASNLAPGDEITFELALRDESEAGLGSVKGQGGLKGLTKNLTIEDPKLNLRLVVSDLDLDRIKPYLKSEQLAQKLAGKISLEANYQGDFGQHFSVEGRVDLTRLKYTDHLIWEKSLPGAESEINYRLEFNPRQIEVDTLTAHIGNIELRGKAHVQNWRKQPIIKHGAFSSNVPLTELVALVPWKKLGEKQSVIRQTLADGGRVIIERASIPELSLASLPSKPEELLKDIQVSARVVDVSVPLSSQLPKLEDITGFLHLEKGVLTASKTEARMGPLTFPTLEARATNLTGELKISAGAKGPIRLAGTKNADVEELLKGYGLESLSGNAYVDLRIDYDQAKPKQWNGAGSLKLEGIRGVSYPAGIRLDELKGEVAFSRGKTVKVSVKDLTARINQALVEVEGELIGAGTTSLVVAGRARTEGLNLAHFSGLLRPLEDLELQGFLDTNIDLHYLAAQPAKTRIEGVAKARGLGMRLTGQNVRISDGNADMEFVGNSLKIKDTTMLANGQKIIVSGEVTDIQQPKAQLQLASPHLNLDRLLPSTESAGSPIKPTSKVSKKRGGADKTRTDKGRKAGKSELPPFLRRMTAKLQAKVQSGTYRGQQFQDLRLKATYENGVLKNHELEIFIGGGRIQTTGSADLRNLAAIPFTVQPAVNAVPLKMVAPLMGVSKLSVDGPLTLTGRLQGRTGSRTNFLGSLRGNLDAEFGPGRVYDLGEAGNALFKILTVLNARNILSGKVAADVVSKGIPYSQIKAQTLLQGGILNVSQLVLDSPAMELDARGDINLVKQRLNINADVGLLGSTSNILGILPVIGGIGQNLTNVNLALEGSTKDPKVRVVGIKRRSEAAKKITPKDENIPKDVIEGFGKGLRELLGK